MRPARLYSLLLHRFKNLSADEKRKNREVKQGLKEIARKEKEEKRERERERQSERRYAPWRVAVTPFTRFHDKKNTKGKNDQINEDGHQPHNAMEMTSMHDSGDHQGLSDSSMHDSTSEDEHEHHMYDDNTGVACDDREGDDLART